MLGKDLANKSMRGTIFHCGVHNARHEALIPKRRDLRSSLPLTQGTFVHSAVPANLTYRCCEQVSILFDTKMHS